MMILIETIFIVLVSIIVGGFIILQFHNRDVNISKSAFEIKLVNEQAERDKKVFQCKLEGTLTIDKLEEIYNPKQPNLREDKQ